MKRRIVLLSTAQAFAACLLSSRAWAQQSEATMQQAIAKFTGGITPQIGKVQIGISQLVDNGNAVPIDITVDHPQERDRFVRRIGLFNEKNPQPDVAEFDLSAASGSAQISTRIRLATTQKLTAVAQLSDGSFWMQSADVIVTLAACIEVE
ncbi:SoxY-related AACIE arm protein [Variovorax sp. PCZ-1]|uniref:SoxY-related AACIE arm protein n=1 Tax=Variovorax sp. PCZ-1 TaxID=2835533 RepID=UPI001BCD5059|nr:SoxY-related AACIE arm protein [Variovorax sp. PCZ-1]MBS7807130.1 SoxY-related AACIE arm protein [Variovorax sp. PCZ-1]